MVNRLDRYYMIFPLLILECSPSPLPIHLQLQPKQKSPPFSPIFPGFPSLKNEMPTAGLLLKILIENDERGERDDLQQLARLHPPVDREGDQHEPGAQALRFPEITGADQHHQPTDHRQTHLHQQKLQVHRERDTAGQGRKRLRPGRTLLLQLGDGRNGLREVGEQVPHLHRHHLWNRQLIYAHCCFAIDFMEIEGVDGWNAAIDAWDFFTSLQNDIIRRWKRLVALSQFPALIHPPIQGIAFSLLWESRNRLDNFDSTPYF